MDGVHAPTEVCWRQVCFFMEYGITLAQFAHLEISLTVAARTQAAVTTRGRDDGHPGLGSLLGHFTLLGVTKNVDKLKVPCARADVIPSSEEIIGTTRGTVIFVEYNYENLHSNNDRLGNLSDTHFAS